jgi:hypothetical protein
MISVPVKIEKIFWKKNNLFPTVLTNMGLNKIFNAILFIQL